MADQDEQGSKLQVRLPEQLASGVYSNVASITVRDEDVTIDFGYILPSVKPDTAQVVSRVNMTSSSAKRFLAAFQNAVLDHQNKKGK